MNKSVKYLSGAFLAVCVAWAGLSAFFLVSGKTLPIECANNSSISSNDTVELGVNSILRERDKSTNLYACADEVLSLADQLAGYYRSDRSNISARSSMPIQDAIRVFGTQWAYRRKEKAYVSEGDLEAAKKVIFNELDFYCAVGKAYGTREYLLWAPCVNRTLRYGISLMEENPDGEWLKIAYERAGEIDNELIAQLSRIHDADDIYLPGDTNGVLRIDWPKHWLCRVLRSFPGYADYSFNPGLIQAYMRSLEGRIGPDAVGTDFCSDIRNRDISWQEFFKRNWAGRIFVKNDLIAFRQIAMGNLFKLRANRMRIAFHLYRLQHGKWPDSFADLDPAIEIPKDPFDGKELRYNSKHRYFWTPGDDGNYDGTLDFDDSGRPLYTDKSVRYVELLEPKRTKPVK